MKTKICVILIVCLFSTTVYSECYRIEYSEIKEMSYSELKKKHLEYIKESTWITLNVPDFYRRHEQSNFCDNEYSRLYKEMEKRPEFKTDPNLKHWGKWQ